MIIDGYINEQRILGEVEGDISLYPSVDMALGICVNVVVNEGDSWEVFKLKVPNIIANGIKALLHEGKCVYVTGRTKSNYVTQSDGKSKRDQYVLVTNLVLLGTKKPPNRNSYDEEGTKGKKEVGIDMSIGETCIQDPADVFGPPAAPF